MKAISRKQHQGNNKDQHSITNCWTNVYGAECLKRKAPWMSIVVLFGFRAIHIVIIRNLVVPRSTTTRMVARGEVLCSNSVMLYTFSRNLLPRCKEHRSINSTSSIITSKFTLKLHSLKSWWVRQMKM